ncbi:thioredoxin domain-containing protein [Qipengyuania soli]|uniref:Thioredoxin domain-containing protein n=1 Tax=Qipengyuania soli TaxID=2782568 RepID=A0A7S8F2M1_9SPHN|nr:thioredoxin domain-containing protein [Qipengyuania soli]QPC97915.1 thioredoxin domain-containing protein [Qipengyuania soli]
MKTKNGFLKALVIAAAGSLALGASAQDKPAALKGNWTAMVTETNGGHLLGNPDAKTKLVEFMSYTCSHCAHFAQEGDGAIKLVYVPTGRMSYEIRHLLRDPVDLTAAMLTHCGSAKKFPLNHQAFMTKHPEWMEKARVTTQAQRARWQFGTLGARLQAIASDLDFYEIMESRGYGRAEVDKCLTDEAKASQMADLSRADIATWDLKGTPSFVLDGQLLEGTHSWADLRPKLDSAL